MKIQNKTILQTTSSMKSISFNKISLWKHSDYSSSEPSYLGSSSVTRCKAIAEQFNLDDKVKRCFIYNTTIMT